MESHAHDRLDTADLLNLHTTALQNMSGPEDFQHGAMTTMALFLNECYSYTHLSRIYEDSKHYRNHDKHLNLHNLAQILLVRVTDGKNFWVVSITPSYVLTSAEPCVNTLPVILPSQHCSEIHCGAIQSFN